MDTSEPPTNDEKLTGERFVLPLLYGSPVLAAAVSVTIWAATEAGWVSLYGRGAFIPYFNGFLAAAGSTSAAVLMRGTVTTRAAMGVVYFAFGILAYLVAGAGLALVALLALR